MDTDGEEMGSDQRCVANSVGIVDGSYLKII